MDSLYEIGSPISFKPFYHKGSDFECSEHEEFFREVIRRNLGNIQAFSHNYRGALNTQQVEAVHSALLVNDILGEWEDPLVIVDGDYQKGDWFIQAIGALGSDLPATAHCQRAENYYPMVLLCDLAAYFMATCIEAGVLDPWNTVLRSPPANRTRENWGLAYSGLYDYPLEYSPADIEHRWGGTVKERIRCWYHGYVAVDSTALSPSTDSITPIARRLREMGYERVADEFFRL